MPKQILKCQTFPAAVSETFMSKNVKSTRMSKNVKISKIPNCYVRSLLCQKMSKKYPTPMSGSSGHCHKPLCLLDDRRQKKDYKKMRKKDCRYKNIVAN